MILDMETTAKETNAVQTVPPVRGEISAQTMTPPRKVDSETMMEMNRERRLESGVVIDFEKEKTPVRESNASQTMTPPRKVDSETMMEMNRERRLESGIVIDFEKEKTPIRESNASQTMTPPRKVDSETMMEMNRERHFESGVVIDFEKEKTPQRDTEADSFHRQREVASQTMTPPRKVDHETMPSTQRQNWDYARSVAFETNRHVEDHPSSETTAMEKKTSKATERKKLTVEHTMSFHEQIPSHDVGIPIYEVPKNIKLNRDYEKYTDSIPAPSNFSSLENPLLDSYEDGMRKKRKRSKLCIGIIVVIVILAIAGAGIGIWYFAIK